jgi:hypothetical protein
MPKEDRVQDLEQEEYRSLGKILHGSVRYTVWARSLADLEAPDGILNIVRMG